MRIYKKREKALVAGEKMVGAWLDRLGYDGRFAAVFDFWDRLLGREAERARAVGLQGRRLWVEVDSHARMHDLLLRKRGLLKKLNQYFGQEGAISDIILRLPSSEKRHS